MEESVNPWIVIVATACSGAIGLPNLNAVVTPDTGYSGSVYSPSVAPAPAISVFRAKTRKEAEELAVGYSERMLDGGIVGLNPIRDWPGVGCSESAVVVSPDGKAYVVKRQSKTKKVMREVEESDGWETVWTERP